MRHLLRLFAVALLAISCSSAPPLRATHPESEAPGAARVMLLEIDGDILKFSVMNLSGAPMVILRDRVTMLSPLGVRTRKSGGVASTYNVAPGNAHDVNVRFDFDDLGPGDVVQIRFSDALLVAGEPVPIEPIVLRVGGRERVR